MSWLSRVLSVAARLAKDLRAWRDPASEARWARFVELRRIHAGGERLYIPPRKETDESRRTLQAIADASAEPLPYEALARFLAVTRSRDFALKLRALRDDPLPAQQPAATNPADPESVPQDRAASRSKDREG